MHLLLALRNHYLVHIFGDKKTKPEVFVLHLLFNISKCLLLNNDTQLMLHTEDLIPGVCYHKEIVRDHGMYMAKIMHGKRLTWCMSQRSRPLDDSLPCIITTIYPCPKPCIFVIIPHSLKRLIKTSPYTPVYHPGLCIQ